MSQTTVPGVSPTLVLADRIEVLSEKVRKLEEDLANHQNAIVEAVSSKLDQLSEAISCHIRKNLEVTGAVSVTAGDEPNIFSSVLENVHKTVVEVIEASNPAAMPSASSETAVSLAPLDTFFTSSWLLYKWKDGTEHYFADDFMFPAQCSVTSLWDLWYSGKVDIREAPYRKLLSMHIKTGTLQSVSNQKTYLVKAKKVMETIENYAVETSALIKSSDLLLMSYEASRTIFNNSFLQLAKLCYKIDADTTMDHKRLNDITYQTFYDRLKVFYPSKRKRKANMMSMNNTQA